MDRTHESLAHERVVLAALVAGAARGVPWQGLSPLCEAVAGVRGLRTARATTLDGLAGLLAAGHARCRVASAPRVGPQPEFGVPVSVRAGARPGPAGPVGEVLYVGDGRWTARRGDREVTGILALEDATDAAVELVREAA